MTTATPAPLSLSHPTSPLPPAAVEALSRLERRLSSSMTAADVAAHEAASYVRRPVDRAQVIAEAMRRLESGEAAGPAGQDPLRVYALLERGGFAAFKTAQRIVAEGGGR